MNDWPLHFQYGLLLAVGLTTSFVNSISGGGSILSLPLLMFLGLPAAEANGTNRLGIWAGSLGSILGFRKQGIVTPNMAWKVGLPGVLGSIAGSLLGVSIPEIFFKPILAVVIIFVVVETLRHPRRGSHEGYPGEEGGGPSIRSGFMPFLVYTGIGFYGGFIQAGSGLIMIYSFSRLSRLNLLQINELKAVNTFLFITLSLMIYLYFGKVKLGLAITLALGSAIGGYLGGVFQVKKGEGFIRVFLLISGIAFAGKLAFDSFFAIF